MPIGKVSGIDWANLASVAGVSKANIAKVAGVEAPAGASYILDLYPGAGVAYSICRKLRNDYSGNAIRIRRASDSSETDIGFDGSGNSDAASIESFCSGTTGAVVTIYDQSGNGYDLTTSSSSANEIYRSGAVVTLNGKPATEKVSEAAGTRWQNTGVDISDLIGSSQFYFYLVGASDTYNFEYIFLTTTDANFYFDNYSGIYLNRYSDYILPNAEPAANTQYIQEVLYANSSSGYIYLDDSDITSSVSLSSFSPTGTTTFRIDDSTLGYFQELIIWPVDQSANRSAIYANLSAYYS